MQRMSKNRRLTAKECEFVRQYVFGMSIKDALQKAGYKTISQHQGELVLAKPIVKEAVEKMRARQEMRVDCSFETLVAKLMEHANNFDPDVSIKAIAELNKMKGNYAPTKSINVNIDLTLETMEELALEYKPY
jgi:hypothetical protein